MWKCVEVPDQDVEGTSDIFFRGWVGDGKKQDTDTHWRVTTGTGNFNWRWKFLVDYPSENTELHFQAWDKDVLKPFNDLIAEEIIDISTALRRAYAKNEIVNPYRAKNRGKGNIIDDKLVKAKADTKETEALKVKM